MSLIRSIWWSVAFLFALVWERIFKTEPPMSYGRITDGNYMSYEDYLAEVEALDTRNRQMWVSQLYRAARGTRLIRD